LTWETDENDPRYNKKSTTALRNMNEYNRYKNRVNHIPDQNATYITENMDNFAKYKYVPDLQKLQES